MSSDPIVVEQTFGVSTTCRQHAKALSSDQFPAVPDMKAIDTIPPCALRFQVIEYLPDHHRDFDAGNVAAQVAPASCVQLSQGGWIRAS